MDIVLRHISFHQLLIRFCFILGPLSSLAQSSKPFVEVKYIAQDQKLANDWETSFVDSLSMGSYLDSIQKTFIDKSYLAFSMDEPVEIDSLSYEIPYFVGRRYEMGLIEIDSTDGILLKELNFNRGELSKLLDSAYRKKISDRVLNYLSDHGYPFATVRLDNIELEDSIFQASLKIDRGRYVVFDTLEVYGNAKVKSTYLQSYFQIERSKPYNRSKLLDIPNSIKNLRFIGLRENPKIEFIDDKAVVKINTKKQRSSSFDFLIGLLRNNENGVDDYTITGEFTAELLNSLGAGESMFLQFRRLKPETQEVKIKVNYPYLFELPFGIDADFSLYKNENEFLDLDASIGLRYQWNPETYAKIYVGTSNNYLLDIDSTALRSSKLLPDRLDVRYNSMGIEYQFSNLDYKYNPRSGGIARINSQVGIKTIDLNSRILELSDNTVDFRELYDMLELNTYQIKADLYAAYYKPLASSLSMKFSTNDAYIFSGDQVYGNELFRIGGNRLLRGFDEQSITVDFYSVNTMELRFILAQENNNFTLALPFIDYAWVYESIDGWEQILGTGVAMDFETKAGLFSFAVASGQRRNQGFDFNNLKIHFGYVSLF